MNLEKDSDSRKRKFKVEISEQCAEDIIEIYSYISDVLKEKDTAKKLFLELNNKIKNIKENPNIYMKVGKVDRLNREYHRIVIKNYIVLYTIDYEKEKVYLSHMFYGRKNYLY